jgi:hypothetical protein
LALKARPADPSGRADSVEPLPEPPLLDLTDFKRDLSELTDRLGHAQDCL